MPTLEEIQMALEYDSLHEFAQAAWPLVDPDTFVDGWHLEAIADHLEAVSHGEIRRLIINIPPRHCKSLLTSVFWPAWDWLHQPSRRFLCSSYAQNLSTRDAVKTRRIIQSAWYRRRLLQFQPGFSLVGDQNQKTRYDNNCNGYRLATSVGGTNTGEGGDVLIVDDAHNVLEGESEKQRQAVLDWWDEVMSTRLSNPRTGAVVLIMQRVHHQDLCGHVLAKELGYEHLCLPARYEGHNRICTSLGMTDPREDEGQPLWPEQYPEDKLSELERNMTLYSRAGQLQQRPTPREGGLFKIGNIRKIQDFNRNFILATVRYWDKAATQDGGKRTAGVLMHKMKNGRIVIENVTKGQWSTHQRERVLKLVAANDHEVYGRRCKIWMEQEPGSGGKDSVMFSIQSLAGYPAKADRPSGDKETRAEPFADYVEAGLVDLVEAEWNQDYIDELEVFPRGSFLDQVDASSGAFNKLCVPGVRGGTWGRNHKDESQVVDRRPTSQRTTPPVIKTMGGSPANRRHGGFISV